MDATDRERLDRLRAWLRLYTNAPQRPANLWPLRMGEVAWILDALERTERERDEARAEVARLRSEIVAAQRETA